MPIEPQKRRLTWKIFFLALGLSVLGMVLWRLGWRTLEYSFTEVGWGYCVILVWPLFYYFFYTWGWFLILPPEQGRVPFGRLFEARLVGEAVNYLTPLGTFGGEPVRALYLSSHLAVPVSAGTVAVDRTLYLFATLSFTLLGVIVAFFALDLSPAYKIAAYACAAVFLILLKVFFLAQNLNFLSRVAGYLSKKGIATAWLNKRLPQFEIMEQTMRNAYRKRPGAFISAFLCHLIGRAGGTLEIWIMLYFLGAFSPNSIWQKTGTSLIGLSLPHEIAISLLVAVFVIVINFAFFMFPSQVGVAEGGTAVLFQLLGLPPSLGVSLQLVRRIKSLAYIVLGLVVSALDRRVKGELKTISSGS